MAPLKTPPAISSPKGTPSKKKKMIVTKQSESIPNTSIFRASFRKVTSTDLNARVVVGQAVAPKIVHRSKRPTGKLGRQGLVASFSSPAPPSNGELIERIRDGLPSSELEELQKQLEMSSAQLVPLLGISKATWHRRKDSQRLGVVESERIVRYARLMRLATDVLESEEDAREWLKTPQYGLGGAIPLEYAQTEVGAREVEDLLGRIEYGVYS